MFTSWRNRENYINSKSENFRKCWPAVTAYCEDEEITEIVYDSFDGAEYIELIWDKKPNGILEIFDPITRQLTISGIPTGLTQDEVYNYTVKAVNLLMDVVQMSYQVQYQY